MIIAWEPEPEDYACDICGDQYPYAALCPRCERLGTVEQCSDCGAYRDDPPIVARVESWERRNGRYYPEQKIHVIDGCRVCKPELVVVA